MRNITVSISDETYREARIWAARNNTSVSAAVQYVLENLRTILRVRKPPRQPRRNNRFPVPPPPEVSSEDMMMLLNVMESAESLGRSHSRTEFSHR